MSSNAFIHFFNALRCGTALFVAALAFAPHSVLPAQTRIKVLLDHRPEQPVPQLGGEQPDRQTPVGRERTFCRHGGDDAAERHGAESGHVELCATLRRLPGRGAGLRGFRVRAACQAGVRGVREERRRARRASRGGQRVSRLARVQRDDRRRWLGRVHTRLQQPDAELPVQRSAGATAAWSSTTKRRAPRSIRARTISS